VQAEVDLARRAVADAPPLSSVFFGGGTPTLLRSDDLAGLLRKLGETFELRPDVEVTTEANPESVDTESLEMLRAAGITRISFGMQSGVPHVLQTLDRAHTPGRVSDAVGEARAAGFANLSLDLIYGTPGESEADWRTSLEQVIDLAPEHISAYALIVEPGTRLAARIARGTLPAPDDDDQAAKYELAEQMLSAAGYQWYEVSNWTLSDDYRSRHNLGYWLGHNWWGFGPGAHSHIGGVRWWNVKHPSAYAARLESGHSPGFQRELLDEQATHLEQVMLQARLREGVGAALLSSDASGHAEAMAREGLLDVDQWQLGRAVLTDRGRLLADLVIRRLTE
jgi:oxygen-independent coproporphyrinogen-3 oxidase